MNRVITSLFAATVVLCAQATGNAPVRFHNEATDTIKINEILADLSTRTFSNPSERCGYIGRKFLGVPYVAHTLEGPTEQVTVNMDELDCTTYVETVLALAYTASEGRTSWRDFVYNLERMRYRGGECTDYASRLHYNCDWAVDNISRGNIIDATPYFPLCRYLTRTIDFMSKHRDKYASLADSANYARIRHIESGYHNHRIPYIRTVDLGKKDTVSRFRDGDAVALVCKLDGLDVTHLGMVVLVDGVPHLMHASMSNGKVEISKSTLHDFMKRNSGLLGVRVYRLTR